jgi:hypothetical protein
MRRQKYLKTAGMPKAGSIAAAHAIKPALQKKNTVIVLLM